MTSSYIEWILTAFMFVAILYSFLATEFMAHCETGIYLLEERTKNVIANYNLTDLLNKTNKTTNYLMLIVKNESKGVKVILYTVESYSITYLIRSILIPIEII